MIPYLAECFIHLNLSTLQSEKKIFPMRINFDNNSTDFASIIPTVSNYYLANLTFGSSQIPLSLIIDTSSSWVLLKSSFNSTSSQCSNFTKNIAQGKGILCSDIFNITSIENPQQFYLELIDNNSDIDIFNTNNGILGLGFSKLSEGYLPFVENLKYQGKLSKSIFSIYLGTKINTPFLTIGGYLEEEYIEKIEEIYVSTYEGH